MRFLFLALFALLSCNDPHVVPYVDDAGFTNLNSCEEVVVRIEKCLGSEGATLIYINSCGEDVIRDINNLNTCKEILDYLTN